MDKATFPLTFLFRFQKLKPKINLSYRSKVNLTTQPLTREGGICFDVFRTPFLKRDRAISNPIRIDASPQKMSSEDFE
jgi:hypothetical protein